jgi:hypothetical protein
VNKGQDVGHAFLHFLILVCVRLVEELCQVIYHIGVDLYPQSQLLEIQEGRGKLTVAESPTQ